MTEKEKKENIQSEAGVDGQAETVKIRIPKDPSNRADNALFVGLNGKRYLIKRGETVEVPRGVAEIIEHSELQAEEAQAYIEANADL